MIHSISKALLLLSVWATLHACKYQSDSITASVNETGIEAIDPIFTKNPAPEEFLSKFFTGEVSVYMMLGNDENNEYSIANVVFNPKARTNWHSHPKGQVLLILAGEGFYKAEGEPVQAISKGDVVNIPPHVNHWHGAASNSQFIHVALTNYQEGQNVSWGDRVTDEEYNSVLAKEK